MSFSIRSQDSAGIAVWNGSLTVKNVDEFREGVVAWLDENPTMSTIVMDMSQVDLLDSSGLGGLLAVLKKSKDLNTAVCIAAISQKVRLVFEITQAHEIFAIYETVDAALAASA